MLNNKIVLSLLSSLGRVPLKCCPSNFLSFLLTTHFQLSSTLDFLPYVPYSYFILTPGNTDGRIASDVAKCVVDQAWQQSYQSFAQNSPLILNIEFNNVFFVKSFPSFGSLPFSGGATLHHVYGEYLGKQSVPCCSSDRNNSKGQVT